MKRDTKEKWQKCRIEDKRKTPETACFRGFRVWGTKLENTPVIIKFVLHRLTKENRLSTYACINYGEAYAPEEIADRSIVINADAGEVIETLLAMRSSK